MEATSSTSAHTTPESLTGGVPDGVEMLHYVSRRKMVQCQEFGGVTTALCGHVMYPSTPSALKPTTAGGRCRSVICDECVRVYDTLPE
ncbi:DUF3039 domain-containing protein [Cutibacterium avidum]|uniref:DUF3039 domain-containing protein n=2 Tax=Cutibacterium avidum TaxID=33010 RepID=UPI00115F968F